MKLLRESEYPTDLLLFHQLRIGAIVDHVFAKHRGGKRAVYLLGIEILVFAVEDEFVTFDSQANGCLFSE